MKKTITIFGFRCFLVNPREDDLYGEEDATRITNEDEALLREAEKGSSKKAKKSFKGDFHDDDRSADGGEEGSGYETREEREGK